MKRFVNERPTIPLIPRPSGGPRQKIVTSADLGIKFRTTTNRDKMVKYKYRYSWLVIWYNMISNMSFGLIFAPHKVYILRQNSINHHNISIPHLVQSHFFLSQSFLFTKFEAPVMAVLPVQNTHDRSDEFLNDENCYIRTFFFVLFIFLNPRSQWGPGGPPWLLVCYNRNN